MWEKIQSHLQDDWKNCWKWASTWMTVIAASLAYADPHSPILQQYIPKKYLPLVILLIFAARIYKQGKKNVQP